MPSRTASPQPAPRSRRRTAAAGAAGAVAVAFLSASCASAGDGTAQASPTPMKGTEPTAGAPTTSATAPAAPTWPLTGLPVDPGVGNRPAVVVKVDNSPESRPHAGINQADVVYELQVEGITRFMEVFHSQDPDRVGPVRSARSSDLELLSGLDRPLLVWSGGNPGVTGAVHDAQARNLLVDAGPTSTAQHVYVRDDRGGRSMPHNLFASLPQIRTSATPAAAGPPQAIFARRPAGGPLPASATDAAGYRTTFGFGVTVDYVWDAERGGWDRFQTDQRHGRDRSAFLDEAGVQVAPENVVVLFLPYSPDPVDGRSPLAHSTGTGEGVVLTGGKAVAVTWSRALPQFGWTLTETATGTPVGLTPGRTFVALPPAGEGRATPLDGGEAAGLLALRR